MYSRSQSIVIAGGGLAGLSLASNLANTNHTVTIIDTEEKKQNDRTWCFWTTDPEQYQGQLTHTWSKIKVASQESVKIYDIAPYTYCMIRSADWYNHKQKLLTKAPNIITQLASVESINPFTGILETDKGTIKGDLIFSSIVNEQDIFIDSRHTLLKQHFMGWWVETQNPQFDPEVATFMDFRVEQKNQTRFFYVLPISPTRALIEFTVFGMSVLKKEEYEKELKHYIFSVLSIKNYTVTETEFGIIPMTDLPFTPLKNHALVKIGTAGGFVKPSAGYAFTRTQKAISKITDIIQSGFELMPILYRTPFKFRLYDSVLLKALAKGTIKGEYFFTKLFEHAPANLILRFLDEKTILREDIAIMKHFMVLSGTFLNRLMNANKI
jgi:lycopene beta-cyclase